MSRPSSIRPASRVSNQPSRNRSAVVQIAGGEARPPDQHLVGGPDPDPGPVERNSVVDAPAARLCRTVGLDEPDSPILRRTTGRLVQRSTTDEHRPEPRQVDARTQCSDQLGGNDGDVLEVLRRERTSTLDPVDSDGGRSRGARTEQHQQAGDVVGGQREGPAVPHLSTQSIEAAGDRRLECGVRDRDPAGWTAGT